MMKMLFRPRVILSGLIIACLAQISTTATAQSFSDLLVGSCPTLIRNTKITLWAIPRVGPDGYYVWDRDLSSGDSIGFYKIPFSDTVGKMFWLELPKGLDLTAREPLEDFYFSKNRLALLFGYRFLIYDVSPTGQSHYVASGTLKQFYMRIWLVGDTVFCSSFYFYFHGGSTWMARTVIPDTTGSEFALTTPPSGDIFSLIKREPISISPSGLIAVADIDKYNIRLFSSSLDSIETLHRDTSDWHGTVFDSAMFDTLYPRYSKGHVINKKVIRKLSPIESASRLIARVDFLDTATLLVTYSEPRSIDSGLFKGWRIYRYDIWEHKGGKWMLAYHDLKDAIVREDAPLECASNNTMIQDMFGCGYRRIVRIRGIPILDVGKSFKQNQDDAEAYVKKHGPMCTLFDFTFVK